MWSVAPESMIHVEEEKIKHVLVFVGNYVNNIF